MRFYGRLGVIAAALTIGVSPRAVSASPAEGEPVRSVRPLMSAPGLDAMPSWSPDGGRIVFHARRPAENDKMLPTRKIWIVDRDGRNAHRLSDGIADEYHAKFSPDGTKIAFVSEANGSRDLWVMDADGKNPLPLTDDPGLEEHPTWAPDGRRIAYVALPKEGGNFDLWVMNADGSGKRKLTTSAANEVFPAWHPDGETIAFVTDVNGNFDIFGFSLSDARVFPIVTGPDNETRPAWSPDGMKIAYTRWPADGRSEDATIWVANADGSVPTEIALPMPAVHPAWSPDGRTLAFQHKDLGEWALWTAELPEELLREGRLRLARQVHGRGREDLMKLRRGEAIYGRVSAARFGLRTPYGRVEVPRQVLASIQFADIAKGTAKFVLNDGGSLSGLFLDDEVEITTGGEKRVVRKEKIEAIGFPADRAGAELGTRSARVRMRNGDFFDARLRSSSLRLRVAGQSLDIPFSDVARVEFGEEGEKTRIVTRKGDTLGGTLETAHLMLDLAPGLRLRLYPPYVRSLVLTEGSP